MLREESTVVVRRPAAEVFKYLLEGENNVKWRDDVLEIHREGVQASCAGRIYRQTLRGWRGRPIRGDYEITKCEEEHEIDFQVFTGRGHPRGVFKLEPQGGDTKISFSLAMEPKGVSRLLAPLMRSRMRHEVESLSRLKMDLEGGGEMRRTKRIPNEEIS